MKAIKSSFIMRAAASALVLSTLAFAQDQVAAAPGTGGWKRVGDPSAQGNLDSSAPVAQQNDAGQPAPPPPPPPQAQAPAPPPTSAPGGFPPYNPNQQGYPNYPQQQQYPPQQQQYPQQPVPASLTLTPGSYLTVRINQLLSSDRNQTGDAFSATLLQPLVVNGVVVAEPGQTLGGRVTEAVKAGHVSGVARLGVQLIDLSIVDGQQIPIQTSLVSRRGPSSVGQDAGTIATTTGLGAAIGAAADWGRGAAIGAGAGAAVGIIGVLVTRGRPSVLYPEQILTFRLEAPVTISTEHAPQAFRYVQPGEYDRPMYNAGPQQQERYYGPTAYGYGYPSPYPYPYYYAWGYPYYWPSVSLWWGRGYYGGYRYYGGRAVVGGRTFVGGARVGGGGGRVGGGRR